MTISGSSVRQLARASTFAAVALLGLAVGGAPAVAEDDETPYVVAVQDISAKTGQPATLIAKVKMKDGYRFLRDYNHRVIMLSSADNGVAFERKSFRATLEGDELIFAVALKSTAPGQHPINGVLRVGYARDTTMMRMVTVPLIATVTGSE